MSTGHFVGVGYHQTLLRDEARTNAFRKAIEQIVGPDDIVVDIGAGSGVLSMFAARAGAAKVYAIESTPVARLARAIVADNGLSDIIEIIEGDAREVELPQKATVLVSECLGNFVYSDGMLQVLADCRRLLTEDARICPRNISMFLSATSAAPFLGNLSFWKETHYDLSFRSAYGSAVNDIYHVQLPPGWVKARGECIMKLALTRDAPTGLAPARLHFETPEPIDALVGWFTADLTDDIQLTTAPGTTTHWGQVVFPIPAVDVEEGDGLEVELAVELGWEDLPTYHWSGRYLDGDGRPCIEFSRGQDLRFEPHKAIDREV